VRGAVRRGALQKKKKTNQNPKGKGKKGTAFF
jgi:hypothetical protein